MNLYHVFGSFLTVHGHPVSMPNDCVFPHTRLIDEETASRTSPSGFSSNRHLDDHNIVDNMNLMMSDQAPPNRRLRRQTQNRRSRRHRRHGPDMIDTIATVTTTGAPANEGTQAEAAPRPAMMMSNTFGVQNSRLILHDEIGAQYRQAHLDEQHDFFWTPFIGTFRRHGEVGFDNCPDLVLTNDLHRNCIIQQHQIDQ